MSPPTPKTLLDVFDDYVEAERNRERILYSTARDASEVTDRARKLHAWLRRFIAANNPVVGLQDGEPPP